MKVLDKSWHQRCVKCSDCNCELNERCFSRDSKLYCRSDFFKRFGTPCSRCNVGFCPEDLVRRAVNKVFHVQCFHCYLCRKQLSTGERLYLVQGEKFLCVQCYQMSTQSVTATASSMAAPTPKADTVKFASPTTLSQQLDSPLLTPNPTIAAIPSNQVLSTPPSQLQQQQQPTSDSKKGKTRTSITPQQLVILLEVYNREQRPSKLTREELMAKTGLDMKVIQVWFQNRRSKEKRDASYREALKEESPHTHVTIPSMPPPISNALPAMVASATPVTASSDNTVPSGLPEASNLQ